MTVTLRPFTPEDAEAVRDIYAPFVRDTAVTFETIVPDMAEIVARSKEGPATWLVAADRANVIGYAYAGSHRTRCAYRFSVETSVYLAPAARGRGVGRALYQALFALLKEQGYVTAFAVVALPNEPSVRFHEALGFGRIGVHKMTGLKHGVWHDVLWLEKLLDEAAPVARTDPLAMSGLTPERVAELCRAHQPAAG